MLCFILSINAVGQTYVNVGDFKYQLNGTEAYVAGFASSEGVVDVVIPETIESEGLTFRVSKINYGAFDATKTNYNSVINSVTTIGELDSIGSKAFWYCNNLKTINIRGGHIGEYAFHYCKSLQKINLTAKNIGHDAFRDCTNLQELTLNAWDIDYFAFQNCTSLQKAILDVKTISYKAFQGCSSLEILDLGNRLTRIDHNAFENCVKLAYVVIPASCVNHRSETYHKVYQYKSGSYYYFDTSYEVGFTDCLYNDDVSYDLSYHVYRNTTGYKIEDLNNAFTGCNRLQAIIYLGNQTSKCGSNANVYNAKDWGTWGSTTFDYCGSAPAPTLSFTGQVAGFQITDYQLDALEKDAGTYTTTVPVTFSNGDITFTVTKEFTYTINPAPLTARVKDASRVYGDANPQFETEYSGFITGEDESVITSQGSYSTSATAMSDAGNYTVTKSGVTAKNYAVTYEPGTLTVTKAPLTMTARNKTMDYGSRVPTLEVDYSGLKNSEAKPAWTTEPEVTTTASSTSDAGTYPITISGGEAKNYNVTMKPGTMTVRKVALTATTMNATREYGDENPDFELTYSGLKNDETAPAWTVEPTFTTPATKSSPVGIYSINATGGEAKNYYVEFVNSGKLTVEKAPLRATARSLTKVQGESNPTLIVDYEGFKNGETPDVLEREPTVTTTATKNSRIGTYPITVKDGEAMNYEFEYVNGTLTIVEDPSIVVTTDDRITVDEVNTRKGQSVAMAIGLENKSTDLTAYQFELTLPAGFSIAKNAKGKFIVTKGDRYEDDEQSLTVTDQGNGIYRFVCFSLSNGVIEGTSGAILNVTIDVADDMEEGTYQASVGNIVLTKTGGSQQKTAVVKFNIVVNNVIMGDANDDGEVNVTDIVEMVNSIMNRPSERFVEAAADMNGDGEVNVTDIVLVVNFIMTNNGNGSRSSEQSQWASTANDLLTLVGGNSQPFGLWLTNEATYLASQFDIRLSAGQSLESVTLNNSRAGGHLLTCEEIAAGLYRVVIFSLTGNPFRGNNGELLNINVKGQGEVSIENILFVTADASEKRFADLSSGTTAIGMARKLAEPADIYTTDGRMVRRQATSLSGLPKGVYIVNGKKEIVK